MLRLARFFDCESGLSSRLWSVRSLDFLVGSRGGLKIFTLHADVNRFVQQTPRAIHTWPFHKAFMLSCMSEEKNGTCSREGIEEDSNSTEVALRVFGSSCGIDARHVAYIFNFLVQK